MKERRVRQKVIKKGRKKTKITYKMYSSMCRFKFDINDFPKEFDNNIINEFGWFNSENPNGITRDHMLSISFGWKRNISPKIISHPANCKLMFYKNNLEKAWRSSINFNELLKRIEEWDKKYKQSKKYGK